MRYAVTNSTLRNHGAIPKYAGTKAAGLIDNLKQTLDYIPIQTDTMLLAAELWAEVRKTGQPTADAKALDGDVILSAQARLLGSEATK